MYLHLLGLSVVSSVRVQRWAHRMEKLVSSTDAAHRSLLSRSVLFRFASISLIVLFVSAGVTESSAPPAPPLDRDKMVATNDDVSKSDIRLVFSDVDGTLVHYPSKTVASDEGNQIIKLPPSATGMQGVISSRTLVLCRELRRQQTVTLVLVSGMRTTTLLKRLPYLPRADAYCTCSRIVDDLFSVAWEKCLSCSF